MNPLSSNVLVRPVFLYALLTIAFLCMGSLVHYVIYWKLVLVLILCFISAIFLKNRLELDGTIPVYVWLCLIYGCLITCIGLIHALGLFMVPGDLAINAEGVTASQGLKKELNITRNYLFFPVMLIGQYMIIRKVSVQVIIRWIAFAMVLSLGVLLYQKFMDHSFLVSPFWFGKHRYEGLATDPNALALITFLLLSLLVIGIYLETNRLVKSLYVLLAILLVPAEWFTGNRTAAGGMYLLIILFPLMMALVFQRWAFRWRMVIGAIPVTALVLGFLFSPMVASTLEGMGGTGARLAQTWHKFDAGGAEKVFSHGEARGRHYSLAGDLTMEAPWAGWGPGGFYREYSNIIYRQTGIVQKAFDSALNHNLMLAGDLGVPVMLLNLGLILIPIILGIVAFRQLVDANSRFAVTLLIASNCIFLLMIMTIPPSYFLDVLWVWTAQLALLVLIAEQHGVRLRFPSGGTRKMGLAAIAVVVTLLAFVGSYQTAFGDNGYAARESLSWWSAPYEQNCYPPEKWDKLVIRWCGKNAELRFPVGKRITEEKLLRRFIKVSHPDVFQRPVIIEYGGGHGLKKRITVADHKWHKIMIPLAEADIVPEKKGGRARNYVSLSLSASRTWSPKKYGISEDGRELGVATVIRFVRPSKRR